jgi:hypothetical protein
MGDSAEGFAMDDTAQFISDLNVARFVDKLRLQRDPATRTVLKRLLLEEVRKLGFSLEQLSKIDRQLTESRARVRAQKNLIERLRTNGRDTEPAEILLSNLVGIQEIFERHRQIIVDSLNRNRL